jgi:putative DNA primase/helicase
MTRRSLLIQLDAGVERPELRTFEEPNLAGLVLRQRGVLLAALFAILKGYQQAQRPGQNERLLGRFEPWSIAVAAPIRWLGYPDPTDSQARLREADPEAERLEQFFAAWFDVRGETWTTAAELIREAEPGDDSTARKNKRAALTEALLEVANDGRGRINRKALGWYLRHFEGRIAGGLRLMKKVRYGAHKHAHQYQVVQVAESKRTATGTDGVAF